MVILYSERPILRRILWIALIIGLFVFLAIANGFGWDAVSWSAESEFAKLHNIRQDFDCSNPLSLTTAQAEVCAQKDPVYWSIWAIPMGVWTVLLILLAGLHFFGKYLPEHSATDQNGH